MGIFDIVRALFFCVTLLAPLAVQAQHLSECITAKGLEHKVVRISRFYTDTISSRTLVGYGGSGWFHLRDDEILTNAHVVHDAMRFSVGETAGIRITQHSPDNRTIVDVRMSAHVLDIDYLYDIARLKLERAFISAHLLRVRTNPPIAGEPILLAGYSYSKFSVGKARIATLLEQAERKVSAKTYDALPISVTRKAQLSAFFRGSSGGPVFDCRGLVLGMAMLVYRKCLAGDSPGSRVCSDTEIEDVHMPNVYGVKAQRIFNLYARTNATPQ